jgi:hypothetical protein
MNECITCRVCHVASAKILVEDSSFGLLDPEDICATILRNVWYLLIKRNVVKFEKPELHDYCCDFRSYKCPIVLYFIYNEHVLETRSLLRYHLLKRSAPTSVESEHLCHVYTPVTW